MAVAIPIIALAATAVSAGVGAYGAISSANAASASATYQAAVAKNNASIASANAANADSAGQAQQQASALQTRAEVGGAIAAQASSGLDVNSGSAVAVRSSDAALGTLSGMNIRNNAARQAYGYTTQSSNFDAQAGADIATGQNAQAAGGIGAAGSLIGGLASGASTYTKLYPNSLAFDPTAVNLAGRAAPSPVVQ